MAVPTRFVEVTPGVLVATSRRFVTTSTVLLDGQGGCVVVDPAWDPDELAGIPSDLATLGVSCLAGVATHEHYDHVMWHPDLGPGPRWATAETVAHLDVDRDRLLAPLAEYLTADLIDIAGRLAALAGDRLPWAGPEVAVVTHDAHAPGHLALLVEESGVLVCGDMLSDIELPMPADDDVSLDTYLAGLERLREPLGRARFLVPGHGAPTQQPMARFDADMRYLDDLLSARPPEDPRLGYPENAELHTANVRRAEFTAGRR